MGTLNVYYRVLRTVSQQKRDSYLSIYEDPNSQRLLVRLKSARGVEKGENQFKKARVVEKGGSRL